LIGIIYEGSPGSQRFSIGNVFDDTFIGVSGLRLTRSAFAEWLIRATAR
jgi:hypothetical protein